MFNQQTLAVHDRFVQKITLTVIVDQAHNSNNLHGPTAKAVWVGAHFVGPLSRRRSSARKNEHDLAVDKLAMRNRRTLPSRQRTHIRLRARFDHLEDAISHFYNVINELRRRVSTLEKKPKP
jgi:hypothetical protein